MSKRTGTGTKRKKTKRKSEMSKEWETSEQLGKRGKAEFDRSQRRTTRGVWVRRKRDKQVASENLWEKRSAGAQQRAGSGVRRGSDQPQYGLIAEKELLLKVGIIVWVQSNVQMECLIRSPNFQTSGWLHWMNKWGTRWWMKKHGLQKEEDLRLLGAPKLRRRATRSEENQFFLFARRRVVVR